MTTIGIDALSFSTARCALDLAELAKARGVDVDKFYIGLGQRQMSVAPPGEDIITLAANAAWEVLQSVDPNEISTILFATESGIDMSKAAGIYLHRLLNLPKHCRVLELKQACYAATGGLQMATALVAQNPTQKVLLVASDISRYALESSAESSQGCGAVAMVISAKPRILAIEPGSGFYTDDVMDFWRPPYSDVAFVEGRYSSIIYLRALEQVWQHYHSQTGRTFSEIDWCLYHVPVPRLVEKAHKALTKINGVKLTEEAIQVHVTPALTYPRIMGNTYTAALYLSLISLLENVDQDLTGQRVGFYSYGSGCVAEYFSGVIQAGYQAHLHAAAHQEMLATREALTNAQYEAFYQFQLPEDGSEYVVPEYSVGRFRLTGIQHHKRQYGEVV